MHGAALQSRVSWKNCDSGHRLPATVGSCAIMRERVCTPPPHATLHFPHADHVDSLQSIDGVGKGVGDGDGLNVGEGVGAGVGDADGDSVGVCVGVLVGEAVGKGVGAGVGHAFVLHTLSFTSHRQSFPSPRRCLTPVSHDFEHGVHGVMCVAQYAGVLGAGVGSEGVCCGVGAGVGVSVAHGAIPTHTRFSNVGHFFCDAALDAVFSL